MRIILASTSKYRKQLLEDLGLTFHVQGPQVNEDDFKSKSRPGRSLCLELAKLKASEVASRFPTDLIIGADQVAHFDGQILSKPKEHSRAISQLELLQGRSHELSTAICLIHPDRGVFTEVINAELAMRTLSRQEIEAYVDLDKPYDCAGSYKFERAGIALFEKYSCEDPTAIVGLPVMALCRGFESFELPLPFLFREK